MPQEAAVAWSELRRRPEAASIGLALPRFLLRLPYGKKTLPLESFAFEEFAAPPAHEDYLWGNPAFAVALLLAQSFSEAGWEMGASAVMSIEGLPLHLYETAVGVVSKPCAEVLLTEDAAEHVLEKGLIPLVSFKDRDVARVLRLQSIADPPQALAGRWAN